MEHGGPQNVARAQDFHGLEAWRGLIVAVLARVSRAANSWEAEKRIPR